MVELFLELLWGEEVVIDAGDFTGSRLAGGAGDGAGDIGMLFEQLLAERGFPCTGRGGDQDEQRGDGNGRHTVR